MLVLIDNYDSFTFNLYQALASRGHEVWVVKNDRTSLTALKRLRPERLMISPGPGGPSEAGISVRAARYFAGRIPVLGVCLGHQCLAEAFGARIVRARLPMHGKTSPILHDRSRLFTGLPLPFPATRYHSLLVDRPTIPEDFVVSAWTDAGEVMGLRHLPTGAEGVQFHPESILCPHGPQLLETFATC